MMRPLIAIASAASALIPASTSNPTNTASYTPSPSNEIGSREISVLIQQAEPAGRFSHLIRPDRQGLCGVR